jgi:pyruvate,water dikinase
MPKKYVVWFKDVDKDDIATVGGKGANLGEMTQAGFPVPPGFIVTVHAYNEFIDRSNLKEKISALLSTVDVNSSKNLGEVAKRVQSLITREEFPRDIALEIIHAYFRLGRGLIKHPVVAVRSSATTEDLPGVSFAGAQWTFLNIQGEANLIEKVKEAWASLFTARAIFYRATNHYDHFKVGIAIPVQKMVESEKSGIMFTIDPVTNDQSKIVIEAIYGLGEMIVQGAVTPDHYEVDKKSDAIIRKEINIQEKQMRKHGTENETISLDKKEGGKQKLTDREIISLAKIGQKLEQHYYFPQDAEWAIEKGVVYLVQTRPVTTTGKKEQKTFTVNTRAVVIAKGDPASPGVSTGPVKLLSSAKEIGTIMSGDVLVAEQTNPDYVPAMRKAVAIVTERGGRTSHAAIVSRELGIPAVVGVKNIRSLVKDGLVVTVNGSTGEVFKGAIHVGFTTHTHVRDPIHTATKVYVNLAEPSRAEAVASMNADGVGLLRAEFMIADIGTHPKKLIEEKKQKLFVDMLATELEVFCKSFAPRPVVYRTTDFKTNEYRALKGGAAFEPEEPNPMLGFRGAARYIVDPHVFELELEAVKTVRNNMGYKNLHLMIPFVRTPKELADVKKIITANDLIRSGSFKLWLMVEIPTNVIRIDDFLDIGIDGVSIGSNDLTMLMLGTDRDNSDVAHDFSELDPTLLWAFEHVITACNRRGITSSMCGQAPSDYPELVERLVSWGISSISVNPDALDHVRETVAAAERRLVHHVHGR